MISLLKCVKEAGKSSDFPGQPCIEERRNEREGGGRDEVTASVLSYILEIKVYYSTTIYGHMEICHSISQVGMVPLSGIQVDGRFG